MPKFNRQNDNQAMSNSAKIVPIFSIFNSHKNNRRTQSLPNLVLTPPKPTVSNNDEGTALRYAAWHGELEVVQHLIKECEVNVGDKNCGGDTALLCAAFKGQLAVVQWLIEEGGAKIDEKDIHGYTALLCATLEGHLEVVQWLLEKGYAKIDEQNNRQETALDLAERKYHTTVVDYLTSINSTQKESCIPLQPSNARLSR